MEEYEEEYTNFDEEAEDKTNPQWPLKKGSY
jgi:hypothetical protein